LNTTLVALTVEYWDGTAWQVVSDFVDQTLGLTRSGFISWTNEKDWKKQSLTPINDVELYYIRISSNLDLDLSTSIQSIVNIYSNDDSLRSYYPELVSDTRFLPADRTNFIDQHIAAKELTVLKLKQRKLIKDEKQILDINEVATAAVHASAYLILNPIATAESLIELAERALRAFEREVAELSLSVDQDDDGVVDDWERDDVADTLVVRR
jgi:hypothetical protein